MEMYSVNSSNIEAIGYDAESATLRIQYLRGGTYDFQGVPLEVYNDFFNAPSKGTYFNEYIKKGGYPYSRLP